MYTTTKSRGIDPLISIAIGFLMLASVIILYSLNPRLFPGYVGFIIVGLLIYFFFSKLNFDILLAFSKNIFFASIILLIIPLILGTTTRGVVRWIPLGPFSIQPSELVRPFLILFFASYLTKREINFKRFIKILIYFVIPFLLILIQPSLGVAGLTAIAFLGVLFASSINKKYIFAGAGVVVLIAPILWFFLAPYQQQRVMTFINPSEDPYGAGYNSIQSMISVGSGRLTGRGLGEGVQTQLLFLPEKENDFIFAAVSEELGLLGASLILIGFFILFWRLTQFSEMSKSPTARAFISGLFTVLLAETFIHVGMNMGLLPITGVPLPLVSSGGSSLLGTMTGLGIANSARK